MRTKLVGLGGVLPRVGGMSFSIGFPVLTYYILAMFDWAKLGARPKSGWFCHRQVEQKGVF